MPVAICNICILHLTIDKFVFFPCGHGLCIDCKTRLLQSTRPKCPSCRIDIRDEDARPVFLDLVDSNPGSASSLVDGLDTELKSNLNVMTSPTDSVEDPNNRIKSPSEDVDWEDYKNTMKEINDQQSELERLQSRYEQLLLQGRLRTEKEDIRRGTTGSVQSGKKKKSSRLKDEVRADEYRWQGDVREEEYSPRNSRKSTKAKPKGPSSSPRSPADSWMAKFQDLGLGSPHGSGSNTSFSPYHDPSSPILGGYISQEPSLYWAGDPRPPMVVHSGRGNTTSTTISNVGNDNSTTIRTRRDRWCTDPGCGKVCGRKCTASGGSRAGPST